LLSYIRKLLGANYLGCSDSDAEIVIKKLPNGSLVAKGPGFDNKSLDAAVWALTRDTSFWTKEELGRKILEKIQ
jgi:hypothetical protein